MAERSRGWQTSSMKSADGQTNDTGEIGALFPPGIAWHWSADPSQAEALLGQEREQSVRMSERRRAAFRHGRHCARTALAGAGCAPCALPIGDGRAPLWPAGYIGSITHTETEALAAVAPIDRLDALGIDLERRGELEPSVVRLVCLPDEIRLLDKLGAPGTAARILFSAKESVFKCVWPTVRRFVDFLEVELVFDTVARRFRIETAQKLPSEISGRLEGRYCVTAGHVATIAYIDSSAGID